MIPNLSTAFFKFFQKISNFLFCPEKPAIRRAFREILHHLDSRQEIAVSSAIPKKIQKSETLNTSLELLRSKPEADIVGHVTSLMPVIPVRHAAANRKRKPKLLRLTLTSARQRSETRPQSGQQKEGENFHLLRAVREAAARYAAVMTFPQDNMSFTDRDLLIFL